MADVASRFGVSAAEVMSALASLGDGPDGAQGVQAIKSKHKNTILSLISQAGLEVVEEPVVSRGRISERLSGIRLGSSARFFSPPHQATSGGQRTSPLNFGALRADSSKVPQQINGYLKHGLGAVLGARAENHGTEGVKMRSVAFFP
jgi:hypothetical protein